MTWRSGLTMGGRRDLAKGILGSKEVRWKWAVWNGVGAQGEGHDGVLGGCRATQSMVKSGVRGAGCSSGGMQSGVPGGRQGEGQSERRSAARGGAQVGGGEGGRRSGRRCGAGWGGMGWDGKRQKWRAKSLRTPFYQYSIYNQKDVLIIVLIILSHPLRSGHSHFHLEQ